MGTRGMPDWMGLVKSVPPGEPFDDRLKGVLAAQNPLLEAARPLIRAVADMPTFLSPKQARQFHTSLIQEMDVFAQLCDRARIEERDMLGARYCLCTALDEAAMQTPWGRGGGKAFNWAKHDLAGALHQDRQGGSKVFLLLGQLMQRPREHLNLLEVIFRLMSVGFEGRYRHIENGHQEHELIRQAVYKAIQAQRPPVPTQLSPNALPQAVKRPRALFDIPVWVTFLVLGAILLAYYGYAHYRLAQNRDAVLSEIHAIGQLQPSPATPASQTTASY
jgi:type VI secretion system protein ImpK